MEQILRPGGVGRKVSPSADLEWQTHVVDRIAPRQQGRILKDEADLPVAAGARGRSAEDHHRTRHRLNDIGDHPQQCGLAATGRAAQGQETALRQSERNVFRGLGCSVRPVRLPPLQQFDDAKKTIAVAELFTIHGEDLRRRPELFGASLRYRIIAGGLVRAEEYINAMHMRTDLARAMQAVMVTVDVVMLPTGEPAEKLRPLPPSSLFTRSSFTTPFNVGGNPALSVCCGFAGNGMPFSLQIAGRLFDDATVPRVGDAYEKATPWRDKRPTLAA
jgi:Asp-tRNA(Asn)/Glu-tRNA(Gln) amidotransferase A subunit family amidase